MNIQSYLPSRNVRIVLLTLVGIGLAYLAYYLVTNYYQPEPETQFIDVALVEEPVEEVTEKYKDSDNDGVYDYIEVLWGLDPNDPDSDDDGVSDARYIKAKQAQQQRNRLGDRVDVESNLTETEKLGRSAYTALVAIAESGGTLDETTQSQFSDNIATYISDLTLGEKIYTRDELNLVEDTQENSLAYRDTMTDLFENYPIATSDLEVLVQGLDNAEEYQGRLRGLASKYTNYLSELTTVDVPYLIAGRHTELVNNVSQIQGAMQNLVTEESDDLVSLSAAVQLEKIMNETADAIVKINAYFEVINNPKIFKELAN